MDYSGQEPQVKRRFSARLILYEREGVDTVAQGLTRLKIESSCALRLEFRLLRFLSEKQALFHQAREWMSNRVEIRVREDEP